MSFSFILLATITIPIITFAIIGIIVLHKNLKSVNACDSIQVSDLKNLYLKKVHEIKESHANEIGKAEKQHEILLKQHAKTCNDTINSLLEVNSKLFNSIDGAK